MFLGSFKYSVDAKGRLSIPARLRKNISADANDTFVLTKAQEKCIILYPKNLWKDSIETKLYQLNDFDEEESRFMRIFLQHAVEDSLDSQSRLLIPQHLLSYAQIEKEVLILGAVKKIELWNPDIYSEYLNEGTLTYAEIANKVMNKK